MLNISGILKTPAGALLANTTVRLYALASSTNVLQGTTGEFVTDADGAYSATLQEGYHRVTVQPGNSRPVDIGKINISADTSATTLNDLLMAASASTPGNPLADLVLDAANRAETAAGSAEEDAATATTKAGEASASATQADDAATLGGQHKAAAEAAAATATTKAGEALASATAAGESETLAGAHKDAAETARDLAEANKTAAATSATTATEQAAAAATSAAASQADRVLAEAAKVGAQTAEANAVAVVSGGEASLTAAPGLMPIAGANGRIDGNWLDYSIPALNAQYPGLNVVAACFYETSKDSDGGAWIHRTAELSYGKEARPSGRYLGQSPDFASLYGSVTFQVGDWIYKVATGDFHAVTSTDGSVVMGTQSIYRAGSSEIPAKVLIVAAGTSRLVVFDASGPELTMWMVFTGSAANMVYVDFKGLVAAEGRLFTVCHDSAGSWVRPLYEINFAADTCISWHGAGNATDTDAKKRRGKYNGGIGQRNAGLLFDSEQYGPLVNNKANAVAVTTLDNAPIDPVTGLKIPTVAVATEGGISVIRDDGNVWDISTGFGAGAVAKKFISFNERNEILSNGYWWEHVGVYPIPNTDTGYSSKLREYTYTSPGLFSKQYVYPKGGVGDSIGNSMGLTRFHENPSETAKGMVAHISATKNTGWMVGDTQLAALCETETGAIVETELVTNGGFDSDTSGWVAAGATVASGQVTLTSDGTNRGVITQALNTIPGKTYKVLIESITAQVDGDGKIQISSGAAWDASGYVDLDSWTASPVVGVNTYTFVASAAVTYLHIGTKVSVVSLTYDNISVKQVIADHSGNKNHLDLVGTLNRSVTGNGQVALFEGYGAANYLELTDAENLAIGTGDFYLTGWFVKTNTSLGLFDMKAGDDSTKRLQLQVNSGGELRVYMGTNHLDGSTAVIPTGQLCFAQVFRKNGIATLMLGDGVIDTVSNSENLTIPGSVIRIGKQVHSAGYTNDHKSGLWRLGKTAPSIDQARKIYRDELAMIQGKAVLDGNDSDVKALAYDRERDLLHVATAGVVSSFRGLERVKSSLDGAAELWSGTVSLTGSGWVDNGNGSYTHAGSVGGELRINEPGIVDGDVLLVSVYRKTFGTLTVQVGGPPTNGKNNAGFQNTALGWSHVIVVAENLVGNDALRILSAVDGVACSSISVKKISQSAPFASLSAANGALIMGGSNGIDAQLPAISIRERLAQALPKPGTQREDFPFTGDGTAVAFVLPSGWKPKRVWVDGSKKRVGSAEDYTVKFDGFVYSVSFNVAPALNAEIDVEAVSA